jgi:molybdopterin/thiamine biosynthesis adenylyltransferase
MYRVEWLAGDWHALRDHLVNAERNETGAFLLVREGLSARGGRLLVDQVLLPPQAGLERAGRHALRPSAQWLSAVIGSAIEAKTGLAFIHSHPDAHHPPTLSPIDLETSLEWSRSIGPTIDGPFASLVWSPSGVSGVMFRAEDSAKPIHQDRFESLGAGNIELLHPVPQAAAGDPALDDRQVRALTALGNDRIRTLAVGVVGLGGTGSPVAEQLVRIGVAEVVLIDPDVIDHESNIRRVVGSRPRDMAARRSKVAVVGDHLRSLGLGTTITEVSRDVRDEDVVRRLLDCDVVISTTDTQSSRALLNQIAYQYWLPTIDVGVRVGTKRNGAVSGMPAEVRVLLPDNACLWCRRDVLDSQVIYEENLPLDARQRLAAEGYVQGLAQHQPSLTPLNYFAGAAAVLILVKLHSGQPVVAASVVFDAWEQFVQPLRAEPDPTCICQQWRGRGDSVPVPFLPRSTI